MREKPILFSGEMVRAIMAGRKTETRRIAVPRFDDRKVCEHWRPCLSNSAMDRHCEHGSEMQLSPYGYSGDLLWVRERWQTLRSLDHVKPSELTPGAPILYGADQWNDGFPAGFDKGKGRPSIFMPRWASRLTLEIQSVKVERLQDITESEAEAEGAERYIGKMAVPGRGVLAYSYIAGFALLWDSINGNRKDKDGNRLPYSWADNPWVWVVKFKKMEVAG